MWGYLKHFEDAKTMSLLVGDKKLFKKYNEEWSEIMEKKVDNNSVFNDKYLRSKIKSHNKKINTNF